MNPPSPARFMVAGGLLVNALIAGLFVRDLSEQEMGSSAVSAGILAVLIVLLTVWVILNPGTWALRLSRGVAASVIVCLVGVVLLFFIAANFESGVGQQEARSTIAYVAAALAAQIAIIVGAERVDRIGFAKAIPATINGGFVVWGIAVAVLILGSMFGD